LQIKETIMKTAYGLATGSVLMLAALAAPTQALAAANSSSSNLGSRTILEQPTALRAELDWNMSADSLQSRLFEALSLLKPDSDIGVVQGKDGSVAIVDKANLIRCQAATIGAREVVSSPHAQVMNNRCDISLVAPYLSWTSSDRSAQAHLFRALESLHELHHQTTSDQVSTLEKSILKRSVLYRLVDDTSASKIACEKRLSADISADGDTTGTQDSPEYRCIFDLRP
jgi:hypothetical protein